MKHFFVDVKSCVCGKIQNLLQDLGHYPAWLMAHGSWLKMAKSVAFSNSKPAHIFFTTLDTAKL